MATSVQYYVDPAIMAGGGTGNWVSIVTILNRSAGGAMSRYAVNGKVPLSVWLPSLDTAGNGTTRLNDLERVNHCNMENVAVGDWVTDTGNAGTRAIVFNGSNGRAVASATSFGANANKLSMSAWIRRPTAGTFGPFFGLGNGTSTNRIELQPWSDNLLYVTFTSSIYASMALDQNWHHYLVTYDGTQTGNSNRLKLYRDGTQQALTFVGTIPATIGTGALTARIGQSHAGSFGAGRFDDGRLFTEVLDASDATYLASARGVVGSVPSNLRHAFVDMSASGYASATIPNVFSSEYSLELFIDVATFQRSWVCSANSAAGCSVVFFSAGLPRISFGVGAGWRTFSYSKGLWRFVFDDTQSGLAKWRAFRNGIEQVPITTTGSYAAPVGGTGVVNFGRRTTGFSGTELPLLGSLSRIRLWNRRCFPSDANQATGLILSSRNVVDGIWRNEATSPNLLLEGGAAPYVANNRNQLPLAVSRGGL